MTPKAIGLLVVTGDKELGFCIAVDNERVGVTASGEMTFERQQRTAAGTLVLKGGNCS